MRELFQYSEYIRYKVAADLRSEVSRYYISYLWWFLEPILHMMVFYLVFGVILSRGGPDFVPFLLIGLATWQWFGHGVVHASNSIMQGKGVMTQVYIPKIVFPFVCVLTDTFKFILVLIVLHIYLYIYGFRPSELILLLPFIMISQLLVTLFIGTLCAAIVPFLPDLRFLITNILQLAFYLSGVFYSIDRVPESFRRYFLLNPMANIIESYRSVLMYNSMPKVKILAYICIVSILGLYLVSICIRKLDRIYPRMVE